MKKKNVAMRASAVLLGLSMITSCFVGGTFAKYTTEVSGSVTARAAHWGFTSTDNSMVLTDMFQSSYSGDASGYETVNTVERASNATAGSIELLLAPGTMGQSTFQFIYNGPGGLQSPEVAYNFKVSTEGSFIGTAWADHDYLDYNNNNYFKETILWALDLDASAVGIEANYGTWDALLDEIEALDGNGNPDGSTDYPANKLYPSLPDNFYSAGHTDGTHTVYWMWPYETTNVPQSALEDGLTTADESDTYLGNMATNALNAQPVVNLKITVTATQID